MQASAQGLLALVTFGLGSLIGTYLAGQFLDHYQDPVSKIHDWRAIWLWPALMAALTATVFFTLFSDKGDTLQDPVVGEGEEPLVTL